MCSRCLYKPTGLTEKPKNLKPRPIVVKHPAGFSQSWTGAPKKIKFIKNYRNSKVVVFTNSEYSIQNGPFSSFKPDLSTHGYPRRPVQQQICRGPNPSLPHLKYGLFKKSKNVNADSPDKPRRIFHEKKQKGEVTEPIYVMRPAERNTRRLSRAASTHLDIKPRAIK